jgi:hypothetical protein
VSGEIECPRCHRNLPVFLTVCWHCGEYLVNLHTVCGVCGKQVGHGRHRIRGELVYVCGCGFQASTKEELDEHLREVRGI